ncbi:MAG TPA: ABC transporter permease, partial [Blastocatellia bacterium]|nr:ABC transporter permease [Blastocatellia bacterium]
SIVLDGISYRIIGVMPAKFDFPARTQVWTNLQVKAAFQGRQFPFYSVIGRLKRGVAIDQAQADMSAIAVGLAQAFPDTNKNRGLALAGWHDQEIKLVKQPILILGGAALFILLIACANVANLLLTALSERQREVAIRTVLGAGRLRIMRQLLTESLLLSGAGGLLGVIISFWVTSAIVKLSPIEIPYRESIGVNGRVLVFALLISMITGAVAGLSPIAAAFRVNLNDSLKLVGSSIAGGAKQDRLRNVLVIVELSLTMMLLVSAGLLIRSFRSIVTIDTGYNPKGLLTLKIELPSSKYPGPADSITFYDNLLTRIDSIKGVRSASCAFRLPQEPTIQVSARPDAKEGSFASQTAKADLNAVSPDYLASLEIPLDAGRSFTRFDNMGSKKVAIIDRGLAKTLWPNTDPIGQTIFVAISTQATPFEVVGVAGSTRSMTLGSTPSFQIYYPLAQFASNSVRLIVRPDGDPDAVVPALRAVISDADKGIPLQGMISMEERLSKSIVGPRFYAVLMASFAAIAILLSVIGLYGVISCLVGRRTHEIGIRMALGAERNDILKMVVFQGLWMVVVGLGLGLAGALAVTRFLRSLLFEIKPTDPATFAGIAVLLVIIALLASYIPARRASKVDPMIALRYE